MCGESGYTAIVFRGIVVLQFPVLNMCHIFIKKSGCVLACLLAQAAVCSQTTKAQEQKKPSLTLVVQLYDGTGHPLNDNSTVHLSLEGVRGDNDSIIERNALGSTHRFEGLPANGNLTVTGLVAGIVFNKSMEQIHGSGVPDLYVEQSQASGKYAPCIGTDFLSASIHLDTGNSIVDLAPAGLSETADMMLFPCRNSFQILSWEDLGKSFSAIATILKTVPVGMNAGANYEQLRSDHPEILGNLLNQLWLLSNTTIGTKSATAFIEAVDWTQPVTSSQFTVIVSAGTSEAWNAASPDSVIAVVDRRNSKSHTQFLTDPKPVLIAWKESSSDRIALTEPAFSVSLYRDIWQATRFWDKEYTPPFAVVRRTNLSGAEAAEDGDFDQLAKYLVENGDPNLRDPQTNELLLEMASSSRRSDLVKLLVEHGASADSSSAAMLKACSNGAVDIATFLLPKVNSSMLLGNTGVLSTCLSIAVKSSQPDILRFLIANGAGDLIRGTLGPQLMKDAVGLSNSAVAALLLDNGAQATPQPQSGLFLVSLAATNSPEMVELLLKHGADPDENSGDPLRKACEGNASLIVTTLLAHGAKPNSPSKMNPPLIDASYWGYLEVTSALLEAGADPNLRNSQGYTALIVASLHGNVEIEAQLLDHGANVNLAAPDGATPLWAAAQEGSKESMAFLLSKGADRNARFSGKTVLEIAQIRHNNDIVTLLGGKILPDPPATYFQGVKVSDMSVDWAPERLKALHSLLFQDYFLLRDKDVDTMPLGLSKGELAVLHSQLASILESLIAMLHERKAFVANHTGLPIDESQEIKVAIIDEGTAGAWTTPPATTCDSDDGSAGDAANRVPVTCITVDAKLLQANFIASLVRARPELANSSSAQQYEAVETQLRWYRDSVDDAIAANILMNPYKTYPRPTKESWPSDFDMQTEYYGTLLFTMAHEHGHAALGHLIAKDPPPCEVREFQADHFASALVGESFVAQSVDSLGGMAFFSDDRLLEYAGWSTFFDQTYEYAGFLNNDKNCLYPARELREAKTMAEFKLIADNDAKTYVDRIRRQGGFRVADLINAWVNSPSKY
jgi:uncharacterized protein